MNELMTSLFGVSWRTSVSSYVEAGIIAAIGAIADGGIPHTAQGWAFIALAFFRAVTGSNSKDKQVSNAPTPGPATTLKTTPQP